MKKIGLIGGLSYLSSTEYYKTINKQAQNILGDHHSAPVVLYSLDFAPMVNAMFNNNWKFIKNELVKAVQHLKMIGCTLIAICCNSVHKVFYDIEIESQSAIPHQATHFS